MAYEIPLYLDSKLYPARLDRLLIERMFNGQARVISGLIGTQRAAGANFTIDISAGVILIPCTSEANGGMYLAKTTAVTNVTTPATPGSNRTDKLIAWVRDPDSGGTAGADFILQCIAGTTTTPENAVQIGTVDRTPGESALLSSAIHDIAPRGGWPHSVLSAPPTGVGVIGDIYVVV